MNYLSLKELTSSLGEYPNQEETRAQLTQCLQKTTKGNKPFLDASFSDGETSINLKIWEDRPCFAILSQLPPKSFVSLSGEWAKNAYGIDANHLEVRLLSDEEKDILLAGSPALQKKQAIDLQEIKQLLAEMSDPRIKAVCQLFLETCGDRFKRAGAARTYHHARRGGLVEHVAGMMRTSKAICSVNPQLNCDLLLAGCLFHDCGKLWENSYPENDFTMPYSEVGELLGHISLGIELINSLWKIVLSKPEASEWKTLDPSSNAVRLHLLHMVASHHGELAFGSPVVPKTPEAMALHYIDNLDAKLEMFKNTYETSEYLGPNVVQRKNPLPANIVTPLAHVSLSANDETSDQFNLD